MNCENMNKTTVIMLSKAKQSKAKQSKAKQSHDCILSNNLNFYIYQIFKAFYFLSVRFHFAKISFLLKRIQAKNWNTKNYCPLFINEINIIVKELHEKINKKFNNYHFNQIKFIYKFKIVFKDYLCQIIML